MVDSISSQSPSSGNKLGEGSKLKANGPGDDPASAKTESANQPTRASEDAVKIEIASLPVPEE